MERATEKSWSRHTLRKSLFRLVGHTEMCNLICPQKRALENHAEPEEHAKPEDPVFRASPGRQADLRECSTCPGSQLTVSPKVVA